MKKIYIFLILTGFISGCAHIFSKSINETETRLISLSNGQHDFMEQVKELEREGIIEGVEVVESKITSLRITGPKSVLACLQEPEGRWIAGQAECEYMTKSQCEALQGEFHECASVCRHNPEATMCIQMCVPVCKFPG